MRIVKCKADEVSDDEKTQIHNTTGGKEPAQDVANKIIIIDEIKENEGTHINRNNGKPKANPKN
jgi:hypothetical protein